MNNSSVSYLRKPLALLGVGLSLFAVNTAFAQKAADAGADQTIKLEKFVITGSNIPMTETSVEAGMFPVVVIDRKTIDQTGYTTAADLLQKMVVSNGGSVPLSNNATGFTPAASSTSVHGLGPEATLVLINGHRVTPFPVGQGGTTAFVDLNTISLQMVERIEVLKDGASAVYGADAVAGVVNIILRQNYEGTVVDVGYGNTTTRDSSEFTSSIVSGVSNDKGHIIVGLNFSSRDGIANRDRTYSAVPPFLSSNASPINAQISRLAYDEALGLAPGTAPAGVGGIVFFGTPGLFKSGTNKTDPNGNLDPSATNDGHVAPGQWRYTGGRSSATNYNQWSDSYPPSLRYGVLVNGDRKIFDKDNIKFYYDGSFQRNYEENTLAPSATGSFLTPGQTTLIIPARTANPILTISQGANIQQVAAGTPLPSGWSPSVGTTVDAAGTVQRQAPAGAFNSNNPFNQDITDGTRFRLADFGNRVFRDTVDAFMVTVGIKADKFFEDWTLDMGFRYSNVSVHTDDSLVSTSRFNKVLNGADPIFNPNSANYIGTTIPYNPFGYFGVPIPANQGVVAYATSRVKDFNVSSLANLYLGLNNPDLFKLPAGDVGFAIGVDYRDEQLSQSPDSLNQLGDTIGSSPATPTNARRKVLAFYSEINLPLVSQKQHIPGLYDLSMNFAARYENFMTSHIVSTVPKVGLHWQPMDDTLTFRASYGKGIRQPSLYELYSGNTAGLQNLSDPRTGAVLQETPIIVGSNRLLRPEKTKSITAGVVWTPKVPVLNGFTIAVDLWKVEREGTVASDLQNTLDRWFGTSPGGKQPGELVLLDPGSNIVQVVAPFVNSGKTTAKGLDISASYLLKTQNAGRFDFQVASSYLQSFKYASLPGIPQTEFAGYDTTASVDSTTGDIVNPGTGNDGYVKWKTRATAEWSFKGYGANVTGNYTDGFRDMDLNGDQYNVKSLWTYDAQLTYTIHGELGTYLRDTKVTVGCLNLFDKDPPASFGGGNNSTGYPGFLYSSVGRFVYAKISKKF